MTNAEFDKWTAGWSGLAFGAMPFTGELSYNGEVWRPSSCKSPREQLEVLEAMLREMGLLRIYEASIDRIYASKKDRARFPTTATTSERVAAMWAMKDEIEEAIERG
jgi:hypothetical protein